MDDKERLRHLSDKQVLTTGEAAELCNVSQQTIIRCFDNGRLTGFRVPGSRFRRIPRAELIRFMKANEIPVELLDGDLTRILVVDDDPSIVRIIGEMLEREDRFEVRTASTGYDAGMMTREFRPNIILLDYMLPDVNGNVVCQRIKADPDLADTRVVIISGVVRQEEIDELMAAGADAFIPKPFQVDALIDCIDGVLTA
ncbi:MAG: response regulator [Phycisphaeraceae bacterium]|nr:regulator [Phycisphaerae bacterium]MCP4013698.1 response regulator [Phycisphaeraceae bacterium]HAC08952.1 regulator [Phycisphaerales bacterium]MCP4068365.1 response regulator [Phycisphaeraceae bacterium]MCP4495984.1 response regulator [Phycisphaeraceae bacterium]